MDDPERGIHELWPQPWEGLPEEDEAWTWEAREKNGRTGHPPHDRGKGFRWYFIYHKPSCQRVKISADQDPETGHWFNPHPSSESNHDDRDFWYAVVAVEDREHRAHQIRERWVKASDSRWYTRMVGMV